jgi:TetR/AcrR family transcriptional regulator
LDSSGKIKAVNATHLLFSIWAMTQSYADFATQMNLVLAQESLSEQDFDDAEEFIVGMVC